LAREEAQGWWFMYHSADGHFATDATTQRSLQARSNQVVDPPMKDAEFPGLARDTPPGPCYYRHEPASARVARKPERDA